MTDKFWSDVHKRYKSKDWIERPSQFAETAIEYFPSEGRILDLGAGHGQDSRYFAEHGHSVVASDIETGALRENVLKLDIKLQKLLSVEKIDLRSELPFTDKSFDGVYAHLSLHYFDTTITERICADIYRILKPGGVFAFFVNSIRDPEYNSGTKIEDDFFQIDKVTKRYFSATTAAKFAHKFQAILADEQGETYKDTAKGVHNLIRYIGTKP